MVKVGRCAKVARLELTDREEWIKLTACHFILQGCVIWMRTKRRLANTFILANFCILVLQGNVFASWYGCAEYTTEQLDSMSETELREAHDKYVKLSHEIYEDAAVQSIMDKRIYHFRSQQYLDCVKYTQEIDRAIKRRFPEPPPAEK